MPSLYRRHCDAWRQPWVSKTAQKEMAIIEFVEKNPGCSYQQIMPEVNVSTSYLKATLWRLIKAEVLIYKNGYYIYEHD